MPAMKSNELAERAPEVLSAYKTDRTELCDALEAMNRAWGAGDETLSNIQLLREADCLAIANSSFSWWGAWLNSRPGKLVIAPRHWFLVENNYQALFPRDWILDEAVKEIFAQGSLHGMLA